ncbi:M56 family metallopeptidase [Spirosoma flavus]
MNTLDYFLKANLYGLLFVSCYWLFLRRHTFLSLNRAYLLVSALLTLVLPLVKLPTQTVDVLPVPAGVIALPVYDVVAPVETGPDWEQIGIIAYGIMATLLVLRLLLRTTRLLRFIHQSPQQRTDDYVLVQPESNQVPTFSFFRYLILNSDDRHTDSIIDHELVHIRQHHSTDVVSLALLRCLFWACPALWLIDKMLRQVHEFLADKAIDQPTDYARFLVSYAFSAQPDTLVNGFFNPSLLKQRILMLHQRSTTRWALGKYVLVIPLALGLLSMTTAREEIAAMINDVSDEQITVSGKVTSAADKKEIPGAIVVVANTGKGIPTDVNGAYKLQNVPKNAILSVSFVGFTTMNIPVEGHTVIDVALSEENPNELPAMGATSVFKSIKPNPAMPARITPTTETINGKVYTSVEEPAAFPTGIPGLMQYVAHELRYPAKAKAAGVEGNVFVEFVVLPTGEIGTATIKKGIGSGCDEEALRIVRQMPRWLPAQQNGKPVATQFVLPIQFALEKPEDKRTGQASPNVLNEVHVIAFEPSNKPSASAVAPPQDEVFTVVEKQPEFPGGMKALGQYLAQNLRYPKEAREKRVQGRVFVRFIVSSDGKIRDVTILKGIGSGCDEEAVRVVSQMPAWKPGRQQGKAVNVQYNLPINFSLEKAEDKRTGQVQSDNRVNEGVAATNSDTAPQNNTSIQIRGNAFTDGDPLYIIDGVEQPKGTVLNKEDLPGKNIVKLDPNTIESISVLKDASAAVYGEKGKNGVILITTKSKKK